MQEHPTPPTLQPKIILKVTQRRVRTAKRLQKAHKLLALAIQEYRQNGEDNRPEYAFCMAAQHSVTAALHELRYYAPIVNPIKS